MKEIDNYDIQDLYDAQDSGRRFKAMRNAKSKRSLQMQSRSPEKELGQHDSQMFNLDNEGTSQFTYPIGISNSPQKSVNQRSVEYNPVSLNLNFYDLQNNYRGYNPQQQ